MTKRCRVPAGCRGMSRNNIRKIAIRMDADGLKTIVAVFTVYRGIQYVEFPGLPSWAAIERDLARMGYIPRWQVLGVERYGNGKVAKYR